MKTFFKAVPVVAAACVAALTQAAPSIAITEFTSELYTHLRHGLPESLSEHLVNSGAFDVYERDKLEMLMKEQAFQTSGFVDPQSAVALGELIGVEYILTGNIVEFGKEQRNFRGYGVNTTTTFHRLKAGVKVIEVATGRIVFSKTGEAEKKVMQGSGIRSSDDTIDTELAAEVGASIASDILRAPTFQQEVEEKAAAVAQVTINSTPENADVEVDGIYYGNAGGQIQIEEGLHTVKVSLPGYTVWQKKVMVRDGLTFNVTLMEEVDEKVSIDVK